MLLCVPCPQGYVADPRLQLSCNLQMLQNFEYNSMNEDKTGWMLLDPTKDEQNAQRILTVWRAVPEVQRPSLVLAVLCTFKKAAKLAEAEHAADDKHLLWQTMAKVPSSVLRSILERAYFHPDFLGSTSQTQHAEGM